MITASTPQLSVSFPDRIKFGTPLTADEAVCLNRILTARMRHYVSKWLEKGITPQEVQTQLTELALSHEFSEKIDENHDPQTLEARRIAREMVIAKLNKEGLVAQEATLELHIQAVSAFPQVIERAKQILEARRKAAREALGR
jgi:hypothetical protein